MSSNASVAPSAPSFHRGDRTPVAAGLLFFAFVTLCPPAVAQLGSRPTEEWLKTLESANRLVKLKVDEAIAALQLKPGSVVADIGAGSGIFTLPLAKAVSTSGKVYAVDIEKGLVEHIAKKATEQKATNVHPVLGKFTDPNLPAATWIWPSSSMCCITSKIARSI